MLTVSTTRELGDNRINDFYHPNSQNFNLNQSSKDFGAFAMFLNLNTIWKTCQVGMNAIKHRIHPKEDAVQVTYHPP
jgi:hypothetical protein